MMITLKKTRKEWLKIQTTNKLLLYDIKSITTGKETTSIKIIDEFTEIEMGTICGYIYSKEEIWSSGRNKKYKYIFKIIEGTSLVGEKDEEN